LRGVAVSLALLAGLLLHSGAGRVAGERSSLIVSFVLTVANRLATSVQLGFARSQSSFALLLGLAHLRTLLRMVLFGEGALDAGLHLGGLGLVVVAGVQQVLVAFAAVLTAFGTAFSALTAGSAVESAESAAAAVLTAVTALFRLIVGHGFANALGDVIGGLLANSVEALFVVLVAAFRSALTSFRSLSLGADLGSLASVAAETLVSFLFGCLHILTATALFPGVLQTRLILLDGLVAVLRHSQIDQSRYECQT